MARVRSATASSSRPSSKYARPSVVVGVSVLWIELDGPVQVRQCGLELADAEVSHPAIVTGDAVVWLKLQHAVHILDGSSILAQVRVGVPTAKACLDIGRVPSDGA